MAYCRVCMADVVWALKEGMDENDPEARVPLDEHETAMSGEGRYRIKLPRSRLPIVEPLTPTYQGEGMLDHRTICRQPRRV